MRLKYLSTEWFCLDCGHEQAMPGVFPNRAYCPNCGSGNFNPDMEFEEVKDEEV